MRFSFISLLACKLSSCEDVLKGYFFRGHIIILAEEWLLRLSFFKRSPHTVLAETSKHGNLEVSVA